MKIGEKIRELRIQERLSQSELAQIVQVSSSTVNYWEHNINEPKACYIISLVKAFQITFDEFFEYVE